MPFPSTFAPSSLAGYVSSRPDRPNLRGRADRPAPTAARQLLPSHDPIPAEPTCLFKLNSPQSLAWDARRAEGLPEAVSVGENGSFRHRQPCGPPRGAAGRKVRDSNGPRIPVSCTLPAIQPFRSSSWIEHDLGNPPLCPSWLPGTVPFCPVSFLLIRRCLPLGTGILRSPLVRPLSPLTGLFLAWSRCQRHRICQEHSMS